MSKKYRNNSYDESFKRVVTQRIRTLVEAYRSECTPRELAEAIGVTRQTVYYWLAGTCTPTLYNATKLAAFYEVDLDLIVGRTPLSKVREMIG